MNFRIRGWIKNGSKIGPDNDRRMEAKKYSQTVCKSTSKPHPNTPIQKRFWGGRAWLRSAVRNGLQLRPNSGVIWQINCLRCRGAPYECKLGFWSGRCIAKLWQAPSSFLHFFGQGCWKEIVEQAGKTQMLRTARRNEEQVFFYQRCDSMRLQSTNYVCKSN